MRITKIDIRKWRNFRNFSIDIPDSSRFICLVGENGTGKTNLLELISGCCQHFGLSSGSDLPRGSIFQGTDSDFSIEIYFEKGIIDELDNSFFHKEIYPLWDRTLIIDGNTQLLSAGGITDFEKSRDFAIRASSIVNSSKSIHHLILDADRAYHRRDLGSNDAVQSWEEPWHEEAWSKKRAFLPTSSLYSEWALYLLSKENHYRNIYIKKVREAQSIGLDYPIFDDHFADFSQSISAVIPHLSFSCVDLDRKNIYFNSSGKELLFHELSGGEREIAFLIGQLERFNLQDGIFLLDEPELHLNPDLVRTWITYLANKVATGQVWIATHSIEAVEAAGAHSTLLLERSPSSTAVSRATKLSDEPVLSALSRAVGTPAFSLSKLRFVLIEGDEAIGERERFRRVTGLGADTRFIECGSCNEVIRRLESIGGIAGETEQEIRLIGVIDRDWRTNSEVSELVKSRNLFCLEVHEIENVFLHKETILEVARRMGVSDFDYDSNIQRLCDARAGGWIIQSALSTDASNSISKLTREASRFGRPLNWSKIEADTDNYVDTIVQLSGYEAPQNNQLKSRLAAQVEIYSKLRISNDLWRVCEGKEVIKGMSHALGFTNYSSLENLIITIWSEIPQSLPDEVKSLRKSLEEI